MACSYLSRKSQPFIHVRSYKSNGIVQLGQKREQNKTAKNTGLKILQFKLYVVKSLLYEQKRTLYCDNMNQSLALVKSSLNLQREREREQTEIPN